MNILETILSAQNGGVVKEMAKNAGASEQDIANVLGKLVPAVSRGIQQKATSNETSLEDLLGALDRDKDKHERYLDDTAALSDRSTVDDGNAILGHIFDSKDVSRNVAGHAAEETGMDFGLVKKLLPVVAAVAMGAMNKKGIGASILGAAATSMMTGNSASGGSSSPAMDMVTSFLDADKDGQVLDDVLRIARRFF